MTKPKVPETDREAAVSGFGRFLSQQRDRIKDSFLHSDRRMAKAWEEVAFETTLVPLGDCRVDLKQGTCQVQIKGHAHGHLEDEPPCQRPIE